MHQRHQIAAQAYAFDEDAGLSMQLNEEVGLLNGYARYLAPDPRLADRLVRETMRRARSEPRALSRRRLLATLRQVMRQAG